MLYVVVVPFDVSGDAPEAWRPFADQVTREVIRNLRKISGLRVVPTPSAFTFRDNKARDHIRRQLPDVQYVLDGVVSISAGNELRITVELEDLSKGSSSGTRTTKAAPTTRISSRCSPPLPARFRIL